MPLSQTTITHTVLNADGTPGSGSIAFTLGKRITNGATTVVPASVTANLNGTGQLSQSLYSNVDPGTIPSDSQWRVDFRILGSQPETFWIVVPVGPGTVDLGTLLPQQAQGG